MICDMTKTVLHNTPNYKTMQSLVKVQLKRE